MTATILIHKTMKTKWTYLKRILSSYLINHGASNITFWHSPLRTNTLENEDLATLRAYPQNFEAKIGLIQSVDNKGVIMLDYKGNLGLQYNPNAIAQLALGYYDRILRGDDYQKNFVTQATYFLDHGRIVENDILLWEYNFPFEMHNYLYAPWRSALAQGQGISVCLRTYLLSKDARYLEAAQKAFHSFRYLAREHPGGVLDDFNGYTWLEEYIVNPPNHVLNGFIWALWGIRDYAVFFNDAYAWDLWNACLKTLRENLENYDLGFWTSYDMENSEKQPTMPSSIYYQRLHVIQMEAMYALTGDPVFYFYAQRWKSQLSNPLYRILSQTWKIYFKLRWF